MNLKQLHSIYLLDAYKQKKTRYIILGVQHLNMMLEKILFILACVSLNIFKIIDLQTICK